MRYLCIGFLLICMSASGQKGSVKLLVDNGQYAESEWCKQIAVTDDDRVIILNDFSNGLRFYSTETGELINYFEGHSLEGDLYLDKGNSILVTTGDKKIKIWDVSAQKLLKEIKQPFHSQFMKDVFIDSKRKYVFAQGTKYDYSSGQKVRSYTFNRMYFFKDDYFIFDKSSGSINQYSIYTDQLIKTYSIKNYKKGQSEFFNSDKGILFIEFTDGVHAIDILTGDNEKIRFDRSETYSNISVGSNFDFSEDGNLLVASSNQSEGHLVVLEKNSGEWKTKHFKKGKYQELVFLNHRIKCVLTKGEDSGVDGLQPNRFGLFDPTAGRFDWSSQPSLIKPSSINTNKNGEILNLNLGSNGIHIRTILDLGLDSAALNNFFVQVSEYGYLFKPNMKASDLPKSLESLYSNRLRKEYYSLSSSFQKRKDIQDSMLIKSTVQNPYLEEGDHVSATKKYIAYNDYGGVKYFKKEGKTRQLICSVPSSGVVYHIEFSENDDFSAFGGSDRKVTVISLKDKRVIHKLWAESYVTSICFSNDNKYVYVGTLKNEIQMFNMATGKLVKKFLGANGSIRDLEISKDNLTLFSISDDYALRFWNALDGTPLLTSYFDYEEGYLAFTPEGYFVKSEKFQGRVSFLINNEIVSFDQLFENYYRPDIIQSVLNVKHSVIPKLNNVSNGIKQPPLVELSRKVESSRGLVVIPDTVSKISVLIKVKDAGGGISGFRLFNNNKLVEETILREPIFNDSLILLVDVSAAVGENQLKLIGISSDFSESKPFSLTCKYQMAPSGSKISPPNIFILSVGINEYKNSKYNLNYCVQDMNAFSDTLKSVCDNIFGDVWLKKYANNEASRTNIINALNEVSTLAKPADVFIFYYAGHGIAMENNSAINFFLIPFGVTQMTDLENCTKNGIADHEIRALLKTIKANKQISFIDACNSGAMAQQYLYRGAAEENAIAKLSRSTGAAIFASTNSEQYASEFAQLGHGVFTHVLIKALTGNAAMENCQITVSTLKSYIDEEVPKVTQAYKGTEQYPTTFMYGQDFPVGVKCKMK